MKTDKEDFYTEILDENEKAIKKGVEEKNVKKLPKQYSNLDEWKNETNKRLKELGSDEKVMSPSWHNVIIVLLILVIIGGIVTYVYFYGWGVINNKFKDEIDVNHEVNLEPNITVNSETNNDYQFNPQTKIYNNYTTINHYTLYPPCNCSGNIYKT